MGRKTGHSLRRVTYSEGYSLRWSSPGRYTLTQGFTVRWDSPTGLISFYVQDGFETDLASIPKVFRGIIPQRGRWTQIAIAHDWAYCGKTTLTKAEADLMFLHGMESAGVGWLKRRVMYCAVRLGGVGHWG